MSAAARTLRWIAAAAIVPLVAVQLVFSARSIEAAYFAARGDAARRAGTAADAREAFRRANRLVPFDAQRLLGEASATREALGAAEAVPLYAESLHRGPYVPLTLLAAAENYVELKRYEDADGVTDTAVRLIGADWRVRLLRGRTLTERGRYAEAERELREAVETASPAQATIHYELARALHAQTQYDAALAQVDLAVAIQPLEPEYRVMRAKTLMGLDRAPEGCPDLALAVRIYQQRLERGDDVLMALFAAENLYALALLVDGRFDEAEAAFADLYIRCTPEQIKMLAYHLREIVSEMFDPFPQQSLWAFALDLMVQTGLRAEYEQTYAAARMLFPESELDPFIPVRARALTAAGDPEGAIALLVTAPLGGADSAPYRLALAEAHTAAGRPAAARVEYAMLLGMPNLSVVIRQQAREALAALPPQ